MLDNSGHTSRRNYLKATGAAATLASLAGCAGIIGDEDDLPTVRLAYVVPVENYGSLMSVPEIQDEMTNMGEEYEIEISQTQATTVGVDSLSAGDLDMTYMTSISYANAVIQDVVPGGFKAVSTDFWDAHPDYFSFLISSPELSDPAELEGRQLATTAVGTGIQAVYVAHLHEVGLTEDDVDFVEMEFPAFTGALEDGVVDAGIYPAFFAGQTREAGFNVVGTASEVLDPYPFAYICASNEALDEKGEAISAWGEDFVDLIDLANEDRDMVVEAAADHFELPHEMLDEFYLTELDYFRGEPYMDVDALSTYLNEDMLELGFVDEEHDYSDYSTTEYLP